MAKRSIPMNPVKRIPLLGCAALLLAAPTAARACSKAPFVSVQMPRGVHLIATAAADTVVAGAGDVRYVVSMGHYGPACERPIYGQVMEVERIGGLAARGLDPSVKRVVLVPWDYGADCRPTPWARSARWVRPGARGLFTATLRDTAHWAGGLPTFDVHSPGSNPYPQTAEADPYGGAAADPRLSMEDYFSVLETLPTPEQVESSAAEAYQPLFRWAEQRPALARRYPLSAMIEFARHDIGYQRMRGRSPLLGGTYRFEARLGDGPPRVFFARTRQRPTTPWRPVDGDDGELEEADTREGYSILTTGALSADSLPLAVGPGRNMDREGYLTLLWEPEPGGGQGRTFRGRVELSLVRGQFPADSAMRSFTRDAFDEMVNDPEPPGLPARFVLSPGGEARVEQTTRLRDGRTLRLTGTRISRETIAEPLK